MCVLYLDVEELPDFSRLDRGINALFFCALTQDGPWLVTWEMKACGEILR